MEEGRQEISSYDKLAIIFKRIKNFNRLIIQVFVANLNNRSFLDNFFTTHHMIGKAIDKNLITRQIGEGALKIRKIVS